MELGEIRWQYVQDVSALKEMWRDWDDLAARCNVETLFNSSVWLTPWFENYWQKNWQLAVRAAWYQGRLVAILPLYIQPDISTAFPLGQGEPEEAEIASEYLDIIAEPQWQAALAAPLRAFIQASASQLKWRALRGDAYLLRILKSETGKVTQASRYVTNTTTFSALQLSKNTRSQRNRAINKLNRRYAYTMRWASPSEFPALFEKLHELHAMRWQHAGKPGAFASASFNKFHYHLLTTTDAAAMSVLEIDGEPAAINYFLTGNDTLYFYQSGWDIEAFKQFSPGLLLHCWSLEHSDRTFYDFMMGSGKRSYKSKYATTASNMHSVFFHFSSVAKLKFHLLNAAKTLKNYTKS